MSCDEAHIPALAQELSDLCCCDDVHIPDLAQEVNQCRARGPSVCVAYCMYCLDLVGVGDYHPNMCTVALAMLALRWLPCPRSNLYIDAQ